MPPEFDADRRRAGRPDRGWHRFRARRRAVAGLLIATGRHGRATRRRSTEPTVRIGLSANARVLEDHRHGRAASAVCGMVRGRRWSSWPRKVLMRPWVMQPARSNSALPSGDRLAEPLADNAQRFAGGDGERMPLIASTWPWRVENSCLPGRRSTGARRRDRRIAHVRILRIENMSRRPSPGD